MATAQTASIAVVGGGVIGLTLAFELAYRGQRPLLLERDQLGGGASRVAAGMLAPASESDTEHPALLRFASHSLALYPEFVKKLEDVSGLACELSPAGALWIALERDQRESLKHLASRQQHLGFDVQWLDPEQAREREPAISDRVIAGLWAENDRSVDPRLVCSAAVRGAIELGARIVQGVHVRAVTRCEDGHRVSGIRLDADGRRSDFEVVAERVVICGGAWTERDIETELPPLKLRPVKGQTVRLRGERVMSGLVLTPDVYVVPRPDGEVVIGATVEEQGFDVEPTAWAVRELLRRAFEAVPATAELAISELGVSLRPAVPDHLPLIGETPVPGLFLATAHHRNGILLAPATALALADLLVGGRVPESIQPFTMSPDRFAHWAD